jgi:hypothetical protein
VPLISFVTCVAIWFYSLAVEGWTAKERTEAVTILDQQTRSATTFGWTAFYSPLTPAGGLHYDYDTEVTPQIQIDRYRYRSSGTRRTVDWTQDQHLSNGWIVARVPAHFKVRKSEAAVRKRLSTSFHSDGSVTVVNGLGTDIEELFVADADGGIHRGAHIPAGKQASLSPRGGIGATGVPGGTRFFTTAPWSQAMEILTSAPEDYLYPRTYIAIINDSPFLESGLGKTDRQARSIVFGILDREN